MRSSVAPFVIFLLDDAGNTGHFVGIDCIRSVGIATTQEDRCHLRGVIHTQIAYAIDYATLLSYVGAFAQIEHCLPCCDDVRERWRHGVPCPREDHQVVTENLTLCSSKQTTILFVDLAIIYGLECRSWQPEREDSATGSGTPLPSPIPVTACIPVLSPCFA